MDQHTHPILAPFLAAFSIIMSWISWSFKDYQSLVSIVAPLVAIASGFFAIRYYIIATKKIKDKL